MKQKVVIKLGCMNNHKLRSKALKISVGCSGVEGARLRGEEKEEVEVIGEGLDIVELTNMLRKCVAPHAELLSVTPIPMQQEKEKCTSSKQSRSDTTLHNNLACFYPQSVPYCPIQPSFTSSYHQYQDPCYCSIM